MKKKFNVRVAHHQDWAYKIEYAYYYIFKSWNPIYQYLNMGSDTNLSCYNPVLLSYKKAVAFAKELKSIDDVIKFQKEEEDKKIVSDKKRLVWTKNNIPVESEEIL